MSKGKKFLIEPNEVSIKAASGAVVHQPARLSPEEKQKRIDFLIERGKVVEDKIAKREKLTKSH